MRAPRFRTLALLLTAGGACLGLFAGSLLARTRTPVPTRRGDPAIESQVAEYVRQFGLDEDAAARIRYELEQMKVALRARRNEILHRHRAELDEISEATGERIREIVAGTRDSARRDGAAGAAPPSER